MTNSFRDQARLIYLVRHATHALVARVLVGRTAGVRLGEEGLLQAELLAGRLARQPIDAVQSSPRERAVETAAAIAKKHALEVEIVPELDEADFGAWTGQCFEDLAFDDRWNAWNCARSRARPPSGESMRELQERITGHLLRSARAKSCGSLVMVTHAEVIRAALLGQLGWSLDDYASLEIAPASVSVLEANGAGLRVVAINRNWAVDSHDHAFSR
jgi:broad specificity phosphatase PhoE